MNFKIPESLREFITDLQAVVDFEPIGLVYFGLIGCGMFFVYTVYVWKFEGKRLVEGLVDFGLLMYFPMLFKYPNPWTFVGASLLIISTSIALYFFKKNFENEDQKHSSKLFGCIKNIKIERTPLAIYFRPLYMLYQLLLFAHLGLPELTWFPVMIFYHLAFITLFIKIEPFSEKADRNIFFVNQICVFAQKYHLRTFTESVEIER